jgi:hypothetical protein
MSVLFPLYALGVLAIVAPLVFHMIQRRPRGQVPFSSLMFLTASPPRLTKRSKLDNLLLLLLRALALLLLAIAFARPFFRSLADLELDTPSRRLVLLVDSSASMRREDLWRQALAEADRVLEDLRPTDHVALAVFDENLRPLVGFDDTSSLDATRRPEALRAALRGAEPTWAATNLGGALSTAAELLQTAAEGRDEQGGLPPHLIVITDMQSGSDLSELDGYDWPLAVTVDMRPVRVAKPENASAVLLVDSEPTSEATPSLAIRVHNDGGAAKSQFRLGWADASGTLLDDREYPIHVPAGESRVVRVLPSGGSSQLLLIGDEQPFDNSLYVAKQVTRDRKVMYLGAEDEDRRGLLFYLRQAALDTPWQKVTIEALPADGPLPEWNADEVPLVVVSAALPPATAALREKYVANGGRVLVVLTRNTVGDEAVSRGLQQLLALPSLRVEEAETADYAMLESIDFQHPVFQPFADPRFSDFTKIRFWTHRRLAADEEVTWNVLANFDDREAALVEQTPGKGACWVLTSGWQPEESQLALSTKFVPLLAGLLDPSGGRPPLETTYVVGQAVALPAAATTGNVQLPDGSRQPRPSDGIFRDTQLPGIYQFSDGRRTQLFAVNLAPSESRTSPLEPGQIEQRGVPLGKARTMEDIQNQRRQLRDVELESRQKWWRWLIAGALGILVAETCLAGWLSRRGSNPS